MDEKFVKIKPMTRAERYRNRVENRICVWCNKPIEPGITGVHCASCAEKNRTRSKENHEALIKMGICPVCRKAPIYPPERSCLNCREKSNANKSDEKLAKRRKRYAENFKKRKEAGLCPACGKRPPEGKYKRCAECRRKQRVRRHRMNDGQWTLAEARKWNGICKCGSADMQPGKKLCKSCYAKACGGLEKARAIAKANRDAKVAKEIELGIRKGKILLDPPITYKKRSMIVPDTSHQRNK